MSADDLPARERALARLAALADSAATALLVAGALTAVFGGPAVWLILAGFVVAFAVHLSVGIVGYWSVMRRPWPQVEPLAVDEDDDWE